MADDDDGGIQWFQQAGLEQQFNDIFKDEAKHGNDSKSIPESTKGICTGAENSDKPPF